ncbi:MAG TPA: HigA family addiction module antitoxin [Azonexus sp.]|nr:HigA family addiction module antitoxin [Azonexus sp.]
MTLTVAAEQLGVSRVTLSKILNGKTGISAEMALRLASWLGASPEAWLEMQTAWDLWQVEQKPQPEVLPLRLAA